MNNSVLDQKKLINMIEVTLRAAESLPEGYQRDAITGGLDAILNESKKPLSEPVSDVLH